MSNSKSFQKIPRQSYRTHSVFTYSKLAVEANGVVLVSLLLVLNIYFTPCSSVSIVKYEQLIGNCCLRGVLPKSSFKKTLQNLQENIRTWVYFWIKLQDLPKETQLISCWFCQIFPKCFFYRTLVNNFKFFFTGLVSQNLSKITAHFHLDDSKTVCDLIITWVTLTC